MTYNRTTLITDLEGPSGEGLRLKPYVDTAGKLSIGVGRNLDDKGISKTEADFLLADDLNDVEAILHGQGEQAAHLAAQDEKILAILEQNTELTTQVHALVAALGKGDGT